MPAAARPWIDLSTGINPHAYPLGRARPALNWRLPDPEETAALEAAAASAFEVSHPGCVAAVPGSEAGLRLLPRLLGARSVAIAGPTYGGHAEGWRATGASVATVPTADIGSVEADVIVVVNPNNPDGRILARETIFDMAQRQGSNGGWLVIDEAFADLAPEISVADAAAGRLIVLRSFGKFYGLPGVRLGFLIAAPAIIAGVRAAFGDWPVSAEAIRAGLSAYPDRAWAARMRLRLKREAARLDRLLAGAGFEIVGGTSLFRLARSDRTLVRFTRLAEAGVLTRPFDLDPSLIRFGLPRASSDWARLTAALRGSG